MANVASFVESKFLNGEMLGRTPQVLTIKTAKIDTLGDDQEQKVIVEFYEQSKPLACNKTQLRTLITLFGEETDAWPNDRVMAYGKKLTSGQFSGKWTIELTEAPAQSTRPVLVEDRPEQPVSESAGPLQPDDHTI